MKKKCHFEINNPAHSTAIQLRLFELGYLWINDSVGGVAFTGSGSLQIRTDDKKITHMPNREWGAKNGYHRLTLDDLYAPPFTGPKPIIVPLNDSYSVEVSKDGLSVDGGGPASQRQFPLSLIGELVEARGKLSESVADVDGVVIRVLSPTHSEAIQKRCFELGMVWGGLDENKFQYTDRECIWPNKYLAFGTLKYAKSEGAKFITLDDLYGPQFTGVTEVPLKVGNHEAKVTKDHLYVGCQQFPASVIDALVEARKQVTDG